MSIPTRTPEPGPARRRPIPAVRISTVALIGAVAAVSIPAGAAAFVLTGGGLPHNRHATVPIRQTATVDKVVIDTENGGVNVTGDATMAGVSGQAELGWTGSVQAPLRLDQHVENGVLTLKTVCLTLNADCGGASITIKVPPKVAVEATSSNGGIDVASVTGGVNLQTSNAGIEVRDLGDGDATMHTTNGGVDAAFSGAPKQILITTSNAGVNVTTDGKTVYYNDISTTNASQEIHNNPSRNAQNEIHVHTTNGSVRIM